MKLSKPCLVAVALFLGTLALFFPAGHYDFIGLDDGAYVLDNTQVLQGLTWQNVVWAFSGNHVGFWHPLTLLSHMLDVQLFGLNPGGHHFTSILIHSLTATVLFLFFNRATGKLWASFLVAALFAWHPLHVESVAWIAERKDVLSGLFWSLTLWSYLDYVEQRNARNYIRTILCFLFGLMSKPTLVTMPFVLLLLDFWPLVREPRLGDGSVISDWWWKRPKSDVIRLVGEKIPFLCGAVISCVLTIFAEKSWNALSPQNISRSAQWANIPISYIKYLEKTFWPSDLSIFYPFPEVITFSQIIFCTCLLLVLTTVAIFLARKSPYLPVGWFWFLGTLVPMIGFVKVGTFAMADRYSYIPLIGIFVMISFGLVQWGAGSKGKTAVAGAVAVILLSTSVVTAHVRLRQWQNNITLFTHDVWLAERTSPIQAGIGDSYRKQGDWAQARVSYEKAVQLDPNFVNAHIGLGCVFHAMDKTQEAIIEFARAVELNPESFDANLDLGMDLEAAGKLSEASRSYENAVRLRANSSEAQGRLATALAEQGSFQQAFQHFATALELNPFSVELYYNSGHALLAAGRITEAQQSFEHALQIKPDHVPSLLSLGAMAMRAKDFGAARNSFSRAIAVDPSNAEAHFRLGKSLDGLQLHADAQRRYLEAERLAEAAKQTRLASQIKDWMQHSAISTQ